MRILLAASLMVFSLAAFPAGKDESATGSSKPVAQAETPPAAWSHLGFHGGWVAQYDDAPPPVAVRLRHRAVAGDRHRKKPAGK
jgi:hypothetical protein